MPQIRNPKAGRIGESPYEPDMIEVDLLSAIERFVDAKLRNMVGDDPSDAIELIDSRRELEAVLDTILTR